MTRKTSKWNSHEQSSKNKQTKNLKEQRELKVPMGQHEAGQYLHYRDSRRIKEKGTEKLFEEIMAEKILPWGREIHIQEDSVSSVAQSCPALCNPMDCSMPGFPVHHQLPEPTQTHVHCISDAIQPSHPLSSPSPASGSFPVSQFFASGGQNIGVSASTSVLPMNIQD